MDPTLLDDMFKHHLATADQVARMNRVREAARAFAGVVNDNARDSADKTAALRKISEAMFTVNRAIVAE